MADCVTEHGHEPVVMDPRHHAAPAGRALRGARLRAGAGDRDRVLPDCDPDGQPVYDGIQCYSLQKGAELEHVVGHIRRVIEAYGIVVEASNTEYGPAQIEINLGHGPAIEVCDDTIVFKSVVREIARNHGLRATFMAKPFPGVSGNGLHLHHSLRKDGENVFARGDRRPAARQRRDAPLGRGARARTPRSSRCSRTRRSTPTSASRTTRSRPRA